jgi:NitT/TauT family transport system permease protein
MRNDSQQIAKQTDWIRGIHRNFILQKRIETGWVWTTRMFLLLVFFFSWEAAGRLRWIDVLLFSYPSKIIKLLWEKLLDGSLLPHVGATVFETIVGFLLGTLLGSALAALLWWSNFLARTLDPFIVVLNSMPKVALGPLFIVGLGPNVMSIIATTLAITVIITTLVVYTSFKEVDSNYVKVVRVFGGNRAQTFRKVILPATIPTIVSTLKVNVGLAWVGVIVGEFLVSEKGLGYLIIYGFQVFNFTLVIGSLFVIAIVATVMYQAVSYLENRLAKRR